MPDGLTSSLPLAFLALVFGCSYIAGGYWIYHDAKARGSDQPRSWLINWLLFTFVGLAYYLWVRDRLGERPEPVTSMERAAAALVIAVFLSFFGSAVFLPPDPFSQLRFFPFAFAVALPLAYAVLLGLEHTRTRLDSMIQE